MLTGMLGRWITTILYEKALAFAKAHCHKEPSQTETAEFLQELDIKLCAALDIDEHTIGKRTSSALSFICCCHTAL